MSEAPQRLAEDPAYAADIAAVKAARPDAAVLARVERRLAQGEAPAPRPRLRFVLVLGVLVSATAMAAVTERLWVARQPVATPAPTVRPTPTSASPLPVVPEVRVEPEVTVEPPPTPAAPAREARPRRSRAPAITPAPSVNPPPIDGLKAQLERFEAAKRALAAGDSPGALRELDLLLGQWPNAAVAPEARALRAEALAKAGRAEEAITAVQLLIRDPAQAARRAEWRRFLGDLQRQRKDCRAARVAYQAALEGKLSPASERAAKAGLAACAEAP